MNSPIIPPSTYVYETSRLVEIFAEAHAGFVSEMAKHEPHTAPYSMNQCFAAATFRDLETAQRLVDKGIDFINLKAPLPTPKFGLVPAVMTPTTKSLTEQVAVMPTVLALI